MRVALVLGGGSGLQADVAAYGGKFDGVVACNDAGMWWPGALDGWVSLHPQFWESRGWRKSREDSGYPAPANFYAHENARNLIPDKIVKTDYRFPGQQHSGSSGLFAAKVALVDLGFDRVVLCGVPMTKTPHFWDKNQINWHPAESFRNQWLDLPQEYLDRMRSMSGWTKVLLGPPERSE